MSHTFALGGVQANEGPSTAVRYMYFRDLSGFLGHDLDKKDKDTLYKKKLTAHGSSNKDKSSSCLPLPSSGLIPLNTGCDGHIGIRNVLRLTADAPVLFLKFGPLAQHNERQYSASTGDC